MAGGQIKETEWFDIAKRTYANANTFTNGSAKELLISMQGTELTTGLISNEHNVVLQKKSNSGRYGAAFDFKLLLPTEALLVCFRSVGGSAFALRHAYLDENFNIEYEIDIPIHASFSSYVKYSKILIDFNEIVNSYPVFYLIGALPGASEEVRMWRVEKNVGLSWTMSANLWGSGFVSQQQYTNVVIDENLRPNGKPFFWISNRFMLPLSQQGRVFGLYFDGASWVGTSMSFLPSISGIGTSNIGCGGSPIDIAVHNTLLYVLFYDDAVAGSAPDYLDSGKMSIWEQTSGSIASATDRLNFANYTFKYNVYINNITPTSNASTDLYRAGGMIKSGKDGNDNPVFVTCHDAQVGARHFARIIANTNIPASKADWDIETPMAFANNTYWNTGDPFTLTGSASAIAQTGEMPRKETNQITFLTANKFIAGSSLSPYYILHEITSWTGATLNTWRVIAPNDTTYTGLTGDSLAKLW